MAVTSYGVNHANAVKLWSKRLFTEALKATYFGKFVGEAGDEDSLIQRQDEMSKGPGDRVRVILRMQLTGDGVSGDGTLEGNEEALTTYYDDLIIDQLRHAVRSGGKMSEQRIPFKIRQQAMSGLKDWWAGRLDTWFANQITGYTAQTDIKYTGLQAPLAVSAGNIVIQGQTTETAIGTGDTFVLGLIDRAVTLAKTMTPVIRPIMVNGEPHYVAFLHPYQVYSMKATATDGQWFSIQKAAMQGGDISDNPIFTGALGVYNNVILHEWTRLPNALTSTLVAKANTKRAVLCGAQAAVFAVGQDGDSEKPNWNEQLFDYGNQLGVEAGMIAGLKKTQFNSADFGTIVMSSYAAAP